MCQIFNRCVPVCIKLHGWTGRYTRELSKDEKALVPSRFRFPGGFILIEADWKKKILAAQQKLRVCLEPYGHKLSETSSDHMIPKDALGEVTEKWNECVREYEEDVLDFFIADYEGMTERVLYIFDQAYGPEMVEELRAQYPKTESLRHRFRAELVPSPLLAVFPTEEGKAFGNAIDELNDDIRAKFLEFAKLDSEAIALAHQMVWRQQIIDKLQTLKGICEEGKKIKGQTTNAVEVFLRRHPLKDYFDETSVCDALDGLLEVLPTKHPIKIMSRINKIEAQLEKGERKLKKQVSNVEKKKRMVRIFQ